MGEIQYSHPCHSPQKINANKTKAVSRWKIRSPHELEEYFQMALELTDLPVMLIDMPVVATVGIGSVARRHRGKDKGSDAVSFFLPYLPKPITIESSHP